MHSPTFWGLQIQHFEQLLSVKLPKLREPAVVHSCSLISYTKVILVTCSVCFPHHNYFVT